MKRALVARDVVGQRASLPGNGERGLKHTDEDGAVTIYTASLPGNGERGLKHPGGPLTITWTSHRSPATGSVD